MTGPSRHLFPALLAAGVTAVLCGCSGLLYTRAPMAGVDPERLRVIEPMDESSTSRPPDPAAGTEGDVPPPQPEAPPPAEIPLRLEDCRALALEGNLRVRATLIAPSLAAETVKETEARFEALFFADASVATGSSPSGGDPDDGTRSRSATLNPGVRVPLVSGGEVSLSAPAGVSRVNPAFGDTATAYSTDFEVSVFQPLLRNAGKEANTHAIRLARLEAQKSEALAKLEIIAVLASVDRTYWRLHAAHRELLVRTKELELAEAQLGRAKHQVETGVQPVIEIMRAELGVAEKQEAVIFAGNAVRERERELKRIIRKPGMDVQSPTRIVPGTEPDMREYRPDPGALARIAMENRMELVEEELRILQNLSTIDFERNRALPLVSLGYTYRIDGLGSTPADSADMLFRKAHDDHRLGLMVEIPLGNEAAKSRVRRAMFQRLTNLATREDREDRVRQEVYDTADRVEATWQRILAADQRILHATRLAEAEQRQFDLGMRTSTDVLETQTRLADAYSARIRALAEYQILRVDLAVACGMLTSADRVRWEPAGLP